MRKIESLMETGVLYSPEERCYRANSLCGHVLIQKKGAGILTIQNTGTLVIFL